MSDPIRDTHKEEEELTLKNIVHTFQVYYREVLSWWKFIALACILLTGILLFKAIQTGKTYAAVKTFLINEDGSSGSGGLSSIIGSFGLGGNFKESNPDRIIRLSTSMRIVQQAIFAKTQLRGKDDYIANHIIKLYDFHDKWSEDTTGLKDFFFTNHDVENFSRPEKIALKAVYGKVKGNNKKGIVGLVSSDYDDKTGIIDMKVETKVASISIALLEKIYASLSEFYVQKMIEKPQKTHKNLKNKVDSLKILVAELEYNLAKDLDTNQGLITNRAKLDRARMERKMQIAVIAYGEAIKNLEIAEFTLKNATPFFQVIDEPILPLTAIKESKIKAIIIGIFMGGFISVAFIVTRRLFREAMD